uniref:Uncharacterized protein n=1 Tax=Oryza sativa subsp. japonica TaxID=39947 RepID=Q6ZBF2_ORYSJ|nr:hypothetical protein [Oryza sativa Japonica Group]
MSSSRDPSRSSLPPLAEPKAVTLTRHHLVGEDVPVPDLPPPSPPPQDTSLQVPCCQIHCQRAPCCRHPSHSRIHHHRPPNRRLLPPVCPLATIIVIMAAVEEGRGEDTATVRRGERDERRG